jgi:hypothetical protein
LSLRALVNRRFVPFDDGLETSIEICLSAGVALDFAARCFGDAPMLEQHDARQLYLVFCGDGLPDEFDDVLTIRRLPVFYLLHHHETLFVVHLDGEGRAATRSQRWMTALDRQLDVLRVMVQTTNDDEVFETARDEELA